MVCTGCNSRSNVANRRAAKSPLATRLAKCTDLGSIHAVLLQQAAQANDYPPGAACTTRPADAVAAFKHLAARWASSPQGPLDAALLADALQPAYALLDIHLSSLPPREIAAIITSLASLRSANPEVLRRLADLLMRRSAPATAWGRAVLQQGSPTSTGSSPTAAPVPPVTAALATAPTTIPAPQPSSPPIAPTASTAPGLSRLTSPELAAVVAALAAFNLRPGDAWLGLCMSCLQLGLPRLSGPQLAQLLWALVQLGVRPTSPWLALYEEALARRLERQLGLSKLTDADGEAATVTVGTEAEAVAEADNAAAAVVVSPQGPQEPQRRTAERSARSQRRQTAPDASTGDAVMSCEDLVRVASAFAELSFQPGERCQALLLEALGSRLGAMKPHQVAGLAWAVTRLGWRVDKGWRDTFLKVTSSLLPQLRAADLPAVLRFVAGAGLAPDRPWLRRCLESSLAHLPQVSPRDLPELLSDLAQVDGSLFTTRGSGGGGGGAATMPAAAIGVNTVLEDEQVVLDERCKAKRKRAGGASSAAKSERQLEALAAGWLRRYLQLCTEKLPRFTAAGVARMMAAVARAGGQPDDRWLQAACAALASKADVLAPSDMADAVTALAALRRRRFGAAAAGATSASTASVAAAAAAKRSAAASAAAEARLHRDQRQLLEVLLAGCATKLSLLPDDRLVGLVVAVADLELQPDSAWLDALLDKTMARLVEAVSTSPPPSSPSSPSPLSGTLAAAPLPSADAASTTSGTGTLTPASRSMPPWLLSQLLVSVAKLGLAPPRRWTAAFLEAAGRQLGAFDAAALGEMIWGLVVLDVRPPAEWTQRLMERVQGCLGPQQGPGAKLGSESGRGGGGVYPGEGHELTLVWGEAGQVDGGGMTGQEQEAAGAPSRSGERLETVMAMGCRAEVAEEGRRGDQGSSLWGRGTGERTRPARRERRYGYLLRR